MKVPRPAFLLIELVILILLVTVLLTIFIGGQAQLLTLQAAATKKLQDLNKLLTGYEKSQCGPGMALQTFQIEKYSITRPTVTDSTGNHKNWVPRLICCLARPSQSDGKQPPAWLPWIVFPQ